MYTTTTTLHLHRSWQIWSRDCLSCYSTGCQEACRYYDQQCSAPHTHTTHTHTRKVKQPLNTVSASCSTEVFKRRLKTFLSLLRLTTLLSFRIVMRHRSICRGAWWHLTFASSLRLSTSYYFNHTSMLHLYGQSLLYPVSHKKCHFVFDYNSGVSCSIFIMFVPVETGMNSLQCTYLMS